MLEYKTLKTFYLKDVQIGSDGYLYSKVMDDDNGHNLEDIMVFLRDILEELHLKQADMILKLKVYAGKELVNLRADF